MGAAHATTAELKQQVFARHRVTSKKSRRGPKSTTIAAYAGVFLLIMSMVAIGYQPPQKADSIANAVVPSNNLNPTRSFDQPSVDQLVATNVAAGIAERADLSIAANVANLSVSLAVAGELTQSQNDIITKPQIIQPSADGRAVRHYTAKAGDTVQAIAQQFGISATTVKWANDLNSDAVEAGRDLTIPPVDGVFYTVKAGDTIESIASKYNADKDRLVAFNDLELGAPQPGKKLVIPDGALPEAERPGYVAPRSASYGVYRSFNAGGYIGGNVKALYRDNSPSSPGNGYARSNCTWYAYERRLKLGRPIGSFWGNAATWASNASANGFRVDQVPEAGAVMQNGGGFGHVAVVESVNSDGSVTVTEMNYNWGGNLVDERTIPASQVGSFYYIH
jgi:surface antigen/LysM repeat protein